MKKYLLIFMFFIFMTGGCSIKYNSNVEDSSDSSENQDDSTENDNTSDNNQNDSENTNQETNTEETIKHDIIAPTSINEDALFYPYTLTTTNKKILEYSYIDSTNSAKYQIYSAYYSEYYDTLYIAYDSIDTPVQTLKAKDLYQIERHTLHYFESDPNKTDYKDYLKAVLIYPDTLGSSCRKGLSDEASITINGCANYVGKEAVISLNRLQSLDHFYNERTETVDEHRFLDINAMRYTFAHEFGHISTFYHMAYKNDEDYEDYLKLRLGNYYNLIYPQGLPSSYSSQSSDYYTQPTEILADDYVELFYNTSNKVEEDTYEYTLDGEFTRNSLMNYSNVRYLSKDKTLYTNIKDYYKTNFLDYTSKAHFKDPIVISSSSKTIEYYDGYSKIGKTENKKTINSKFETVNLIAVGSVIIDKVKYYRVILSNTFNITNSLNEKEASKKMGYVKSGSYVINNNIKLYEINYDRSNNSYMSKNSMVGINNYDNIYILPYYDFSYVLSLTGDVSNATTYDYLNNSISNQQYTVNIYSFGTRIN